MAQHDYIIANQDGASFRGDLNAALAAIVSQNSGATEPAVPYADMLWYDTTAGVLKKRNSANTAWVTFANDLLAGKTIAGTLSYTNQFTRGTSVASTSGTTVEFLSIPNWVRRIVITLSGVSTNSTVDMLVQIGTGSFTTSGYTSNGSIVSSGASTGSSSSGFKISESIAAADTHSGAVTLLNHTGNTWVSSGLVTRTGTGGVMLSAGTVTLAGVLDRVRLSAGGASFDAGSVNVFYE